MATNVLTLGKGIKAEVKDGKLLLAIDLAGDFGRSASGKSNIVATTSGNVQVEGTDGLVIGFNAYRKA